MARTLHLLYHYTMVSQTAVGFFVSPLRLFCSLIRINVGALGCLFLLSGCVFQPDQGQVLAEIGTAARAGHTDLVKYLISTSHTRALRISWVNHPVIAAAQNGHWDTVEALLDRKTPLMTRDNVGNTLLHMASFQGNVKAVRDLIRRGISVKALNLHRSTPLHLAVHHNRLAAATLLLDAGAPINAQNDCAETPLYVAAWTGNIEIFELLLKRKANASLRPRAEESIEAYVVKGGHPPLKKRFEEALAREKSLIKIEHSEG